MRTPFYQQYISMEAVRLPHTHTQCCGQVITCRSLVRPQGAAVSGDICTGAPTSGACLPSTV